MGDFLRLYHLEAYLFGEVAKRFQKEGTLSAFDFFCIVIWKANRAKSRVATRLVSRHNSSLEASVDALLRQVSAAPDNRGRLGVLIEQWGFRLPMASAILTVLYPEDFTVYDVRVCDLIARVGGDGFAVLLTECAGYAPRPVERLRIATPASQTCSAGFAIWN